LQAICSVDYSDLSFLNVPLRFNGIVSPQQSVPNDQTVSGKLF
jgi:hypothetical protein